MVIGLEDGIEKRTTEDIEEGEEELAVERREDMVGDEEEGSTDERMMEGRQEGCVSIGFSGVGRLMRIERKGSIGEDSVVNVGESNG